VAKASDKKVENAARLRYIRVLERFSRSIVNYLSRSEAVSKEIYDKKVDSNLRYLERTPAVHLYKGEYSDLEALVRKMREYRDSDASIEELSEDLLYRANQLEKSVNRRRYKKEKHNKSVFDEWS
jgi:hypothetical protein